MNRDVVAAFDLQLIRLPGYLFLDERLLLAIQVEPFNPIETIGVRGQVPPYGAVYIKSGVRH